MTVLAGSGWTPVALRAVGGVIGGAWLLVGLAVLHASSDEPPAAAASRSVSFEVAPPPPKPPAPKRKARPRPRRRASSSRKAPPKVASALTGPSHFGLDTLPSDVGDAIDPSLLGDTDDVVMTEATVDTPPSPRQRTAPSYPAAARRDGVTGEVVLHLLIDASGAPERITVLEAQPPGVFDDAAVDAVNSWRFEPARYQGRPVRAWARQRVKFELR